MCSFASSLRHLLHILNYYYFVCCFLKRLEAQDLLVANIPDVFNQLLGIKNARRGTLKVFDALQDQRLNKHLFYELLEVVIKDSFPELSAP